MDTKHGHRARTCPPVMHHETSDVNVRPAGVALGVSLAVLILIFHGGHEGCLL